MGRFFDEIAWIDNRQNDSVKKCSMHSFQNNASCSGIKNGH